MQTRKKSETQMGFEVICGTLLEPHRAATQPSDDKHM